MKTLYNIYEASILGDIETAINKDDITEALWKGLCNYSNKDEYQDAAKMLTDLLKSDAVEARLVRSARSTAAYRNTCPRIKDVYRLDITVWKDIQQ